MGVVMGKTNSPIVAQALTGKALKSGKYSTAGIRVEGAAALRKAFRELGDAAPGPAADAFEQGIWEASQIVTQEIKRGAPGSMSARTRFDGLKGKGIRARGRVVIQHPGAKSMEFGRQYYWVGYVGRAVTSGTKLLHRPGQIAKPFVGIVKGGHALGRAKPDAAAAMGRRIEEAFAAIASQNVAEDAA